MTKTIRYILENSDCRIAMGIEDASPVDFDLIGWMTEAAIDAGANQIILADTTGYSSPRQFGHLIRFIKSRAGNGIGLKPITHVKLT